MKIAVAGLGFMGSTHLKAMRSVPSAQLSAVVSGSERKRAGDLRSVQGNLPGSQGETMDFSAVRKYRNLEEALADPDIEAVDICLPTYQHAPAVLGALRAGKHVLVEKPLALDFETANLLVAEARRAGRILMAAQVLRFFPDYCGLAGLVRGRSLGPIRSAFFRRRCAAPAWSIWLADPARSGGGVFDLLVHDVDFCIQLFGLPEAVRATGYQDLSRGIDWIEARLEYPETETVIITGGWHHPKSYPFSMEFTVVCDEGTLEYSSHGRPLTIYRTDGSEDAIETADADAFAREIGYFVDCAQKNVWPELCPPEESALAVGVTGNMLKSRELGGEKVPCRF